jgi:hypothetical protein
VWVAMVTTLVGATPARAGHALVDLLDVETLEQTAPATVVEADRALDLLLVESVRERIAAGALAYGSAIPVVVVYGDPGPALAAHARLSVGELLQLVLLTRSRSAVATLAAAAGPGVERARLRLRRTAARLALHGTTVPGDWPAQGSGVAGTASRVTSGDRKLAADPRRGPDARTTVGDLARLAASVASDAELRRRLALDGAPIADGAVIVRATDPLIARVPSTVASAPTTPAPGGAGSADSHTADSRTAIAIAERDGLALLAVASGTDAVRAVRQVLERGLTRYRRVEVVRAGQSIGGDVAGRDGVLAHITAVAAQSFALTVPRSGPFALRAWLQLPEGVGDAVAPNQPLGELVFEQAGRIIGAVPLIAPATTAPNGWLDTAYR